MNAKTTEWFLRLAVAGEFVGHGMFALQGKAQWVGWITKLSGLDSATATTMLLLIGSFDLLVALIILIRPIRIILLWAIFWGFFTALVRPLAGESGWDFVERWANWGAPLAILFLRGYPRSLKDLLK